MPTHPPHVIELHLRRIAQLFNSLDPSPFNEKDLDDDAEEFIVGWAMEYPLDASLRIVIDLDEQVPDAESEQVVRDAIHNFFTYRASLKARELRNLFSRGRIALVIGLAFLALCVAASELVNRLGSGALATTLRESLFIVGWVALWRPLEIFLYDWWPVRNTRRLYEKLAKADIEIVGREG